MSRESKKESLKHKPKPVLQLRHVWWRFDEWRAMEGEQLRTGVYSNLRFRVRLRGTGGFSGEKGRAFGRRWGGHDDGLVARQWWQM